MLKEGIYNYIYKESLNIIDEEIFYDINNKEKIMKKRKKKMKLLFL